VNEEGNLIFFSVQFLTSGHELGHYKMSHNMKNLAISQIHIALFLFLFGQTLNSVGLYRSFGFTTQPVFSPSFSFLSYVIISSSSIVRP